MSIDDLSNPELVTIAVSQLGGTTKYVDREDVAIVVDKLAPGRFNWRKYPERIDMTVVHFALHDARKARYGSLLVGGRQGWMLSPAGIEWIEGQDLSGLDSSEVNRSRKHSLADTLQVEQVRLRNTRAYVLFVSGDLEQITLLDFYEFARINEYFKSKKRQRRFHIIDNTVANDETLASLWEQLKTRFFEELE